jgi:hypothetical protein
VLFLNLLSIENFIIVESNPNVKKAAPTLKIENTKAKNPYTSALKKKGSIKFSKKVKAFPETLYNKNSKPLFLSLKRIFSLYINLFTNFIYY